MSATILIVDDDETVCSVLAKWLKQLTHTPLCAASAEEALNLLRGQPVDMVITDIKLPNMSGLSLSEILLREDPTRPVLIITGYAELESAQKAISMGVYAYLTKPLEMANLTDRIKEALYCRFLKLGNLKYQKELEDQVQNQIHQLQQTNNLLSQAERAANLGCWQLNPETGELFCSDNFYRIIGLSQNTTPTVETFMNMVSPSDRSRLEQFITDLSAGNGESNITFQVVNKNGKSRYFYIKGNRQTTAIGKRYPVIAGILMDTTAQKNLEKQIEEQRLKTIQADRLHGLGEMAAGIAHELNQPLTVISTIAEGLCLRMDAGMNISLDQIREQMADQLNLVDRMNDIINHMRLFSRDTSTDKPIKFQISQILDDSLKFVKAQLKSHGIRLDFFVSPDLPSCYGWPHELEQVVLNLISNAKDAIEDRKDKEPSFWEPVLGISADFSAEKNNLKIEISDSGNGIPEPTLRRIFDPFFTTKEVGKGTGLGLSISKTLVEKQGGQLTVKSTPFQGTTFSIFLPVSSTNPSEGVPK